MKKVKQKKERKLLKTKKRRVIALISACFIVLAIVGTGIFLGYNYYIVPKGEYDSAVTLAEQGKYEEAVKEFQNLGEFQDSEEKVKMVKYKWAGSTDINKAISLYKELGGYKDSKDKLAISTQKKKDNDAFKKIASAYHDCSDSGTSLSSDKASITVEASSENDYESYALMGRQTENYYYLCICKIT